MIVSRQNFADTCEPYAWALSSFLESALSTTTFALKCLTEFCMLRLTARWKPYISISMPPTFRCCALRLSKRFSLAITAEPVAKMPSLGWWRSDGLPPVEPLLQAIDKFRVVDSLTEVQPKVFGNIHLIWFGREEILCPFT